MEPEKERVSLLLDILQDRTLWMGIVAYIALEIIKTSWGKDNFGEYQGLATHTAAGIMLLLAIFSGKKSFDLAMSKFQKKVKDNGPESTG